MSSKKKPNAPKSKGAVVAKPEKSERTTPRKPDVAVAATEKSRKAVIDSIQSRLDGKAPTAPKKPSKGTQANSPAKRLSAIDAAAQVLAKSSKPMRPQELIDTLASRGLWTSPGGKTPAATLSAAIGREIKLLGNQARFVKAERGFFAARKGST